MSRVLFIPDLHCPATRKGALEFCLDLQEEWDCNEVVFAGDVIDWHAISHWTKEPSCPGPLDEYELAKECVKKWYDAFPDAMVCIGNHDERPNRLAKTVNIPDFMLKSYADLWDTPGWKWNWKFMVDEVSYRHGTGCSGIHPAWNMMNKVYHSVAIGHCHTRAGVKWGSNGRMRIFGLDAGCLIDEQAWQFTYGRDNVIRPFLSAAVIIDGHPYLEAMRCSKGEAYYDGNF